MLDCKLCGEVLYTSYLCSSCNRVKDMMNLYSREVVIEVLENVLIRNEKQRLRKIELIDKKTEKK
jgi:hypothetical protein